jgi:hypothetical protein
VSATATLCTACVAIASVSGGIFVHAAPAGNVGVKKVETVDDYIVVRSTTTIPAATSTEVIAEEHIAAQPTAATSGPPVVEPAPVVAKAQPPAPAPAATEAASETSLPESIPAPDPAPAATHTRTRPPTTDQTSDDGYGSADHHHSDDGHDSGDGGREGGDG